MLLQYTKIIANIMCFLIFARKASKYRHCQNTPDIVFLRSCSKNKNISMKRHGNQFSLINTVQGSLIHSFNIKVSQLNCIT